jgi:TRAP-type uncharacterized transport system substrate-binding protein
MSAIYTNCFDLWLGKDAAAHTRADLDTDTIKVGLADTGTDYTTPSATTDQDWADTGYTLDVGYNSEPTQTLGAKTITAGVFDNTADVTFTAVAIDAAKTVDAIVHYRSGGTAATDTLICFHDAFTPVTPNGGDIVVAYHASGIFAL